MEEFPHEHRQLGLSAHVDLPDASTAQQSRRQGLDGDNRTLRSDVHDAGPISAAALGLELPVGRMRHCQRIAATLQAAQVRHGLKTVAIASAATGEGKTTTMLGLAMVLARNSSRVLLVDANFCRPTLHDTMRIEQGPGLIDVISGERPNALPVVLHASLHVLLAGRASMHPAADLGSERLRGLLKRCAAHYDWVLVDTPAVSQLVDDADVLGRLTDGVVFVIGAATPFAVAERAMATIGEGQILATLLDGLTDPVPHP